MPGTVTYNSQSDLKDNCLRPPPPHAPRITLKCEQASGAIDDEVANGREGGQSFSFTLSSP